jgi:hypothetical protein
MSKVYADVLNALTKGLYNELRWAIREYLQNAYDAIRIAQRQDLNESELFVKIDLTNDNKNIIISDTGIGMDEETLRNITSIGGGGKVGQELAGYKGIGKLSGLIFFEKFIVRTTTRNMTCAFELEWDAGRMMNDLKARPREISKIEYSDFIADYYRIMSIDKVDANEHFTQIQLLNVRKEFQRQMNFDSIVNYIKADCPVPFHGFKYSRKIEDFLGTFSYSITTRINHKDIYEVTHFLTDNLHVLDNGQNYDFVEPICKDIKYNGTVHAKAWFTWPLDVYQELELHEIKGIRYRIKGIVVGDNTLFKKLAKNSDWFVGEIIITSPDIEPNSARNDLMEGESKDKLLSELKKQLGFNQICQCPPILPK